MSTVPEAVMDAARGVCAESAFLEWVRESWPYLGVAAEVDRHFGQGAQSGSDEYKAALAGLRCVTKFAGPNGLYVVGLAKYGNMDEADVARDLAAVARLEKLLVQASNQNASTKQRKKFLPLLAEYVREWHDKCNLPEPALSDTSPAIVLMQKIGSAHRIEIGSDNYRKALAALLKD